MSTTRIEYLLGRIEYLLRRFWKATHHFDGSADFQCHQCSFAGSSDQDLETHWRDNHLPGGAQIT